MRRTEWLQETRIVNVHSFVDRMTGSPILSPGGQTPKQINPSCQRITERIQRVVGHDNCVWFQRQILQIPPDQYRCHYVKAKMKVLQQPDGVLVIRHGPRELARYDATGKLLTNPRSASA